MMDTLREAAKASAMVSAAINANLEPYQRLRDTMAATIGPALQQMADAGKQWHAVISPVLEQMVDTIRYVGVSSRFWAIMLKLGWPPPIGVATDVMEEIIRTYDEQGEAAAEQVADTLMVEVYDEEAVIAMAAEWWDNPVLARRVDILRQVVSAHQTGHYALSVPALLGQMEGVIADGFQHRGRMHQRDYQKYLKQLLESDDAVMSDPLAKEFILTIVLAGFEHGEPLSSSLSRHAILHGADTAYGTATNSLKAILLFNYLQASLQNPPLELSNEMPPSPNSDS